MDRSDGLEEWTSGKSITLSCSHPENKVGQTDSLNFILSIDDRNFSPYCSPTGQDLCTQHSKLLQRQQQDCPHKQACYCYGIQKKTFDVL